MNVSAVLAILRQTPLTVGALLDGLPERRDARYFAD